MGRKGKGKMPNQRAGLLTGGDGSQVTGPKEGPGEGLQTALDPFGKICDRERK